MRLQRLLRGMPPAAKRPFHVLLAIAGVDLHVAPAARFGYRLVKPHHWGRDYRRDLKRLRPTIETACVVGAFHGATSRELRKLYPRARIINCEPDPDTFAVLDRGTSDPGIINLQTAVGDTHGYATLNRYRSPDTNSLLPFEPEAVARMPHLASGVGEVQVPITTLDAIAATLALPQIDYVHVDTQGYEDRLLRGAQQLLAERRVDVWLLEVMFDALYVGQPTYLDVCASLAQHHYRLVCLQGLFFEAGQRAPRSGNIMFVRE
jgi:FkbM family methyltransferase